MAKKTNKVVKEKKEEKIEYPIYEMEAKGKLVLPAKILAQINYLHSHIGRTEWSGMLLYDVIKGNPSDPKNFELKVEHIFLMDVGSMAFTEYETDGDIVEVYDEIPEAMEMKMGHVHTHHDMGAYFSGTDMDELMQNVDKHNYYLSLIVNFSSTYKARIAFLSDIHSTAKLNYIDDSGVKKHFKNVSVKKQMVIVEMRIIFEGISDFFDNRLAAVQKKVKEAEKKAQAKLKGKTPYSLGMGNRFGETIDDNYYKSEVLDNDLNVNRDILDISYWEIEKLTRQILLFNPSADSSDSVYTILNNIANAKDEETDIYFEYVGDNVMKVISVFLGRIPNENELTVLLKEISACINRFESMSALKDIINELDSIFGDLEVNYDADALETELETVKQMVDGH